MSEESPISSSHLERRSPSPREASDTERAHFEVRIAHALPWIHEASNPYWDWLWGSPTEARAQLREWLSRPNSELSAQHVVCLSEGDRIVGGYIALPGREVQACRKADLLALMNYLRRNARESMIARMRQARSLFASVAENEFYLSRMGVASSARGRGVARRLVEMFLQQGRAAGFNQFRLDVAVDNERAIRLYRAAGFAVASDSGIAGTPIRYCAMAM